MTDNQFNDDFLKQVRPKLAVLENLRLEKLKQFLRRKKIAIPIATVVTPILGYVDYWLFLLQRGNDDQAAGVSIVFLALLWGWVVKPKRDYAKAYKTKILPEIAGLFGQFTYDVKGKIPMDSLKPSKIVPKHNSYKSEDLFRGEYKSVGIEFSEMNFTKQQGKKTVNVFNGLAILLTHGVKKFHGHTILTRDQGKLSSWFLKQTKGLKRANMVDLEFERLFDVYTDDQTEARYLIDPVIIESLKSLYNDYHGEKMMASFYNDKVFIMIESRENHFEPPSIHTPATNEAELITMKREVGQVLSIIDRLSLYNRRQRRRHESAEKESASGVYAP